jgi:hypothetical protein
LYHVPQEEEPSSNVYGKPVRLIISWRLGYDCEAAAEWDGNEGGEPKHDECVRRVYLMPKGYE